MVASPLVATLQNEAFELVKAMQRSAFPFKDPLWIELPETSSWRLVVLAPTVEREGPRVAYRRVRELLEQIGAKSLSMDDIYLLDPADYRSIVGAASQRVPIQPASDQAVSPIIALDPASAYPAITHADGKTLVTAASPAHPGSLIVIYARGLGPISVSQSGPHQVLGNVRVELDGLRLLPVFAGQASLDSGIQQVNVQIPRLVEPGKRRIRIVADGVPSNEVELAVV